MALFVLVGGRLAFAEVNSTEKVAPKGSNLRSELTQKLQELKAQRESLIKEFQAKKKEVLDNIKIEKKDFEDKLKVEKADFEANIKEKRSEFRGKAEEILSGRFVAAVKNITSIQDRIAARIAALKTAGKDVSQAETYLSDSKLKLGQAQTKLAEIKALIPTTDLKVTVENWQKIKQGANDVKNLIKESHQDLVEAVKILKGFDQEKSETTSTSAE